MRRLALGFILCLWLCFGWALLCWAGHSEPVGCAQQPALTGDVTTNSGSCTTIVGNASDSSDSNWGASTGELDKTSNTTLADVTGLQIALTAGKTYSCFGHLAISAGASGGVKFALVAGGGLSATSISYSGLLHSGTTVSAMSTATALGTAIGATAAVTDVFVTGAIVVNLGGSISVQAAQNASNSTTTKVLVNSTFTCKRVN